MIPIPVYPIDSYPELYTTINYKVFNSGRFVDFTDWRLVKSNLRYE